MTARKRSWQDILADSKDLPKVTKIDSSRTQRWGEGTYVVPAPLEQRLRSAFIKTYEPVMDDAPYRVFDTTGDYRRWCEENLPSWLGYGRE